MSRKVLITGIGGQDGYFLAKLLLNKGCRVHGLFREKPSNGIGSLAHLEESQRSQLVLYESNISNKGFIDGLVAENQFDDIYHLAAQSSVARSIQHPRETIETNVLGLTNIATSIRDRSPQTRLLFTGSSEMFGDITSGKQSEATPAQPQSPYGLTKEFGYQLVKTYRKHYGIWASTAILFNHESEFRGEQFVTKKIIRAVVRIASGSDEVLSLGNIYAKRDWGYAGDYMDGVIRMMEKSEPDDYVFATGELHSVKDFVNTAFSQVGIVLDWSGDSLNEIARNRSSQNLVVKIDEAFYRPGDIKGTCGNAEKAKLLLGWGPQTNLRSIISKMISHEKDTTLQ
jgi:GDPmannose 4,6-dehydratase